MDLIELSAAALPLVLAITLHEAAHGYTANALGDDTAKRAGRLSFNPLKHVDPFGTVILPGLLFLTDAPFLFGYAKPVPVDFSRLRQLRRDMALVAAAGPVTNIVLMLAGAALLYGSGAIADGQSWLGTFCAYMLLTNAVIACFNLLPIPPLDGSKIATALLFPRRWIARTLQWERYGMLILFALLAMPAMLASVGIEFPLFQWLVGLPAEWLVNRVLSLFA